MGPLVSDLNLYAPILARQASSTRKDLRASDTESEMFASWALCDSRHRAWQLLAVLYAADTDFSDESTML
jgi:hypothetical protein